VRPTAVFRSGTHESTVTVIGIDDTDSRERGMCTTYLAACIADALEERGVAVTERRLVRLNPAVEYKTRGNAALAVETAADTGTALSVACEVLPMAETADPRTNPGVVVAESVPDEAAAFARRAVREHVALETTREYLDGHDFVYREQGNGRGLVGALAAVGAGRAFDDWTYECISYRERDRWGTPREVDYESVRTAADDAYPTVWDTVDRVERDAVCVPHTPCPILHGIRGDDPDAVRAVAAVIESEPVARRSLFRTNQGTDAHLRDGTLADAVDGRAYRLDGTVAGAPETRRGGHVFLVLADGDDRLQCAAFEPTKRFRDRVRALRVGDRLTVCGEVSDGTLKLEKFAVRDLVTTERVTPDCPVCGRSMESAGRGQGYRCRDCDTSAPGKVTRDRHRDLDRGWYEVPPCARRHVAKPLVRGGFDAPVHPER
jgi:tRNA(Ile2)-agmatinylcytidine synthase